MINETIPSPDVVCNLLEYAPSTGKLYWKPRPREMFTSHQSWGTWMTRYSEKEAFTSLNDKGYFHGTLLGKNYLAHRIAFCIHHGRWPAGQVDHADRCRTNNKPDNLREATAAENLRNKTKSKNKTSKFLGVHWCARDKSWIAKMRHNGITKCIGYFHDEQSAAMAYDAAAKSMHGEFASPNFK